MDSWWARLVSGAPTRPPSKSAVNDPEIRLAKFKRLYHNILALCNRPRDLATEAPVLDQLHICLEGIDGIIREETRAPAPHLSLQFAAANKIYTVITRAATVSQHEPIVRATVSVLAALIDSEEEDFLSNATFAKSLMRLVAKIMDSGTILISLETETSILELLFTIAAKIRLQPEILTFWFRSTAKPELEDVFVKEKRSFVGITQREDFPLCYLFIDRVHHEGRIGDFARTGLLYVFEATGRSLDLEEWVVSSDLPTLMASGLGALYSQLSRELSILHPDTTLPAVLAMSDYSTTHARATAESAFSERHQAHMATFLSYLAFWQDVLDHCKSADVKQTLLDHFQILFLQQLLYPSLLQSSDTDAGSSVAVLAYLTAMLDSLEYPDLVTMMLEYLLAMKTAVSDPSIAPTEPPRSPTTLRRRQSLMLLTAPKDPDEAVEPALFNLVDLIMSNISSQNSQAAFSALKLASTILTRQKKFAFGTLLRIQKAGSAGDRTLGALELEVERYSELALTFHKHTGLEIAYTDLAEDVRIAIEAQVPFKTPTLGGQTDQDKLLVARYIVASDDRFLRALSSLSRTFLTNSVDLNLGLTQTLISVALCKEIRLESWFALDPSLYHFEDSSPESRRPWQAYLDTDENEAFDLLQEASRRPVWSDNHAPALYTTLSALSQEVATIRANIPNLGHLISVRKTMLQATSLDSALVSSDPHSEVNSPTQAASLDIPDTSRMKFSPDISRSSSLAPVRSKATNTASPQFDSVASSPDQDRKSEQPDIATPSSRSIFLPPPPDAPITTDILMQKIAFPAVQPDSGSQSAGLERSASLNHVLTNVVVLQEFVLELVAVLQVRAGVFGNHEVRFV